LLQVINASSDGVGHDFQAIGFKLSHRLHDVGDLKHDQESEITITRNAVQLGAYALYTRTVRIVPGTL